VVCIAQERLIITILSLRTRVKYRRGIYIPFVIGRPCAKKGKGFGEVENDTSGGNSKKGHKSIMEVCCA
jgi:hypothetical protein